MRLLCVRARVCVCVCVLERKQEHIVTMGDDEQLVRWSGMCVGV